MEVDPRDWLRGPGGDKVIKQVVRIGAESMDPKRRRFYIITAVVFLTIILGTVVIVVYTEYSYVRIEVTGSDHAHFLLSYDSTSTPIPLSQNYTIEVLPHANVTIVAYPDASYVLSSWHTSGAQVLKTGNDTIDFLTGQGGETITVSAILLAKPQGSA